MVCCRGLIDFDGAEQRLHVIRERYFVYLGNWSVLRYTSLFRVLIVPIKLRLSRFS